MSTTDKVRIVVVGDSGVGKTSLVHLICHGEPIKRPCWTIGCSVEVKLHDYRAGMTHEKAYFVELWDVGGWSAHASSRSVFYQNINGIMLVHDLTNRKSYQNLRKWLSEVLKKGQTNLSINDSSGFDVEQLAGSTGSLPIIIFGTKMDLCSTNVPAKKGNLLNMGEEWGSDEIQLDCTQVKNLSAGTSNAVKLARFFDKVIEHKLHHQNDIPIYLDKRKPTNRVSQYE